MKLAESLSAADRDSVQPVILARWLDLDPTTALQWVSALPKGRHRNDILNETFISLGAKNPQLALQFLDGLTGLPRGSVVTYRGALFRSWAERDPRAATEHAVKFGTKSDQGAALSACIHTWAKQEPHAAVERIRQMPQGEQRRLAYQAAFNEWAIEDPTSAANEALALTDEREREGALTDVIFGACHQDAKLGRELMSKLSSGSAQKQALGSVLGCLVNQDPKAATDCLANLPAKQQFPYIYAIALEYAQQDVHAALDWASKLPTDELRKRTIPAVLQRWATNDPQGAFQYASANQITLPSLLPDVLATWAKTDPYAALTRAETLADSKVRESSLSQCLEILGRTAPEEAIREASKLSDDKRRSTLSNIATTWANKDPAAAANWLMQKADPDLVAAIPGAIRNWTRESPTQAAQWLQQLPPGKTRDSAISSFILTVRETAPESAAEWTLVIGDNQLRENAIRDLVLDWRNYDKNAAMTWLRQAPGISEQTRQSLLQQSEAQR